MHEPHTGMRVGRFGPYQVNLTTGELRKHGIRLKLQDQPFQILALLLARPGKLVTREEIRQRLWPSGTFVDFDNGLNTALSRLREVLGDSAESPRYIETLARRGYRLIVSVDWMASRSGDLPAAVSVETPSEAESASNKLIGKKVSNYRILELLGAGGMGVVYKAQDLKLDRGVALKFLPQELVSNSLALNRFECEARAASALNHPHICTIYAIEEYERQPFIVMELLEGQTLQERIGNGSAHLQTNEVIDFAIQITDGLDAAHQRGIIHRDIKTANIFLTNRGEAKIVDFGLAKIVDLDEHPHNPLGKEVDETPPRDATTMPSFDPTLTRPGAMMGTAPYMSPEQVRGEKLDSRTDLFSFGLVLYEMATGQRAFRGDTAMEVNEAILHSTPAPARDWNAELPPKLQEIITKALQKERELRYQRAAEMRADLKHLKSQIDSGRLGPALRLLGKLAAASFLMLLLTSVVIWLIKRQPSSPSEPTLRQLTANSSENPIGRSAISPDGKYLAFSDATTKLRVKNLTTDETLTIPEPESLKGSPLRWEIPAWFPDGTRFLANARGFSNPGSNAQGSSIWIVSLGGVPRKLRDDAEAFSVSPDGSLIAFGEKGIHLGGFDGDREVWLMDPSGQQARKLYDTDTDTAFGALLWSRDGQRTLYDKFDKSTDTILTGELKEGAPTTVRSASQEDMGDYLWLPDGRLIYSSPEKQERTSQNYWALLVDPQTGKSAGKPRRLTNWAGFRMDGESVTADGKRMAFTRVTYQETLDLADIQANGARITLPRRLTLSENDNEAQCWTPDGKTLIFQSQRNGHGRLFKQPLDSDTEEPLFAGAGDINVDGCSVSPDGSWLFYYLKPRHMMRIPISGGTPQLVLRSGPGYWYPRCAVSPAKLCVNAEQSEDGKPIIFTAFDALKGRGQEVARFETERGAAYNFALSPDGTRISILKGHSREARIHTLFLNGQAPREVSVKGWSNLQRLFWAAKGNGWFTSGPTPTGWVVLHVDLQGVADRLWEQKGPALVYGLPSPDGRHLAIDRWTVNRNVWVMENF
jgi:serine/threonine protein kinase